MKKHPVLMGFAGMLAIGLVSILVTWAILGRQGCTGPMFPGSGKIAIVDIDGVITHSRRIIKTILEHKDNPRIKAIILRIDSPGGGVGPSQEIYAELLKVKLIKPVIVSMGSVAASGGYYIACAADTIYANPGTITGSIGVIIESANIEELLGKIGMKSVVIKSGKYKDILSPSRGMSEDERKLVQGVIDSIHGQFIDAVTDGRHLARDKVVRIADGRIFSGQQAKELGLVDSLGTLQDAIAYAAEHTGLDARSDVIYPDKKRPSLLQYLIDESITKFSEKLSENRSQLQFLMPGYTR